MIPIFTAVALLVSITWLIFFPRLVSRPPPAKHSARADVNAIEASIKAYFEEYGRLPVPDADQDLPDKTYGSNEVFRICNTLRVIPQGWNTNHVMNPKQLVFLEPSGRKNAVDKAGRMLDPWGNIYWIALDNDGNGQTIYSNAVYSVTSQTTAIAVSFGPNGKPDDPAKPGSDDILTSQ